MSKIKEPDTRASYRDVFGVGEFRAIFAAGAVSMLGNVVAAVALTVLVFERTRSPALAALVMALSFAPYLVGEIGRASCRERVSISVAAVAFKIKDNMHDT